jgi:hypothetical protein
VWYPAPHFLSSILQAVLSLTPQVTVSSLNLFLLYNASSEYFVFLSSLYKLDSIPQTNFRNNWSYESTFGRIWLKKIQFTWNFWCQRTKRDKFWTHYSCFLGDEYSMFHTPCHYSDLFRTDYNEVSGAKAV